MKRLLLLFTLALCGLIPRAQAQCGTLQLGIVITNQEDVDSFAIRYPNCTQIMGDLTIAGKTHLGEPFPGTPISNLQGLNQVKIIEANLVIRQCDSLADLRGLEGIEEIHRDLHLNDNSGLVSLEGLNNLRTVRDVVVERPRFTDFTGLDSLSEVIRSLNVEELYFHPFSFKGLEQLKSIGQNLHIDKAPTLTSMAGLKNLETIGLSLVIQSARDLSYLGMEQLQSIGGEFFINLVDSLEDFSGMGQLRSIDGNFTIGKLDALKRFDGLEGLESIGENFYLGYKIQGDHASGLAKLQSVGGNFELKMYMENTGGLEQLQYVGGDCHIDAHFPEGAAAFGQLAEVGGDLNIDLTDRPLTQLYSMPNLTKVGKDLTIFRGYQLRDLHGLHKLKEIGEELTLQFLSHITDFSGLDSLQSVDKITLIRANSLQNFYGLEALQTVDKFQIESCLTLRTLEGMEPFDQLSQLELMGNDSLNDISAIRNIPPSTLNYLLLRNNPKLSVCHELNICNYLHDGGGNSIFDNAPGCNSFYEVLDNCEDYLRLHYQLFYDLNQNKRKDSLEAFLPGACIYIAPLNYKALQSPDKIGQLFVEEGSYTVSYDPSCSPEWGLSTDSSSYQVSVDYTQATDTLQFGLYPTVKISEVIASVHVPTVRCGTSGAFEVHAHNLGTTVAEGTLWLELKNDIEFSAAIDSFDVNEDDERFGWHFTNLTPGYSIGKKISLQVPISVGSPLQLDAYVEYTDDNGAQLSQTFEQTSTILCAYDPNDKLVTPGRDNHYTLFEEDLFYTIRFQNTGNAEAYDVFIRDTLDSQLDYSSFRVLGTSHPEQLQTLVEDDRHLLFEFKNIFLPDSTSDFEGSQGYVSYRISPLPGLPEQTEINNSASIYFDFNPPIHTNLTRNILVSELVNVSDPPSAAPYAISISPNPTNGEVQIKSLDWKAAQLKLMDSSGQLLLQGPFSGDALLDMEDFPDGLYFLSISTEQDISTHKLLKLTQ